MLTIKIKKGLNVHESKKVMIIMWIAIMFGLCGCQMEVEEGEVNKRYLQVKEIEFIEPTVEYEVGSDFAIYQTKIKNNSESIIKGLTIEVELENGQHTTIVTEDTLKPKDISSWVRCVGPSSMNLDDVIMTRFTITTLDKNSQEIIITYDVGRDFYTYEVNKQRNRETPLVKIEEIEFINPTLVESHEGILLQTYLKNNSNHHLQTIRYEFEDQEGETYTLFSPLEIKSQSESPLLTASFLTSLNWDDYEVKRIAYTYEVEDELVYVVYDVRLEQYFIQ